MTESAHHVVEEVTSLCPVCREQVPARIVEREGRIYQRPQCANHQLGEALIFSDAALYRRLDEWNKLIFPPGQAGAGECGPAIPDPPLLAVIDITNRCNFSCPLCFAEASNRDDCYCLDLETIRGMLESLQREYAVPCRHVQFSGGEPTLHPEFPAIVRLARELGFTHIQVATNGSRFLNQEYAQLCEEMGLHTLYLQFDGMSDEVYKRLRGRPLLEEKVNIVTNIAKTSMRIVLVPTIVGGVNVDQIGPTFRFALEHSKHITGISMQPAAMVGRIQIDGHEPEPFDLATMGREFGCQTGLTRFPEDWFPLNAVAMITRGLSRARGEALLGPACDAHCSLGTFFYIDDDNRPVCLTRFLDLDRFFRSVGDLEPAKRQSMLARAISKLRGMNLLVDCFDRKQAPRGLSFQRLLRGMEAWEDKSVGRGPGWFRRGFNGMFVAGMHFMDHRNYNFRRLGRCIIKYVTTAKEALSFCSYNAGVRYRTGEEAARQRDYGHRVALSSAQVAGGLRCDHAGGV